MSSVPVARKAGSLQCVMPLLYDIKFYFTSRYVVEVLFSSCVYVCLCVCMSVSVRATTFEAVDIDTSIFV